MLYFYGTPVWVTQCMCVFFFFNILNILNFVRFSVGKISVFFFLNYQFLVFCMYHLVTKSSNARSTHTLSPKIQFLSFSFSFSSAKSFIVSIWSKTLREGSRMLKSCLVAAERGFRQPWCQVGSSKAIGLQKVLVVLEGEPLWRDTRPTQPGDQPACWGWSGGHPSSWWVSRPHLGRGSPANHRCGGLSGQKPGHADPTGLDSCSSLQEGWLP